jgi:hypothetical protein
MMITQERLVQLANYDPATGLLVCAQNRKGSKNKVGDVLGSLTKCGHIEIQLDSHRYLAHRLAFLAMTGSMPTGVVDHINRNPGDNRWSNLRDVTQVENGHNQDRNPQNNRTGFVGVHRWKGKYRAKLVVGQKQIHLGTFDDPSVAAAAYRAAKQEHLPLQEAV